MKLSELIRDLAAALVENGDLPVVVHNTKGMIDVEVDGIQIKNDEYQRNRMMTGRGLTCEVTF